MVRLPGRDPQAKEIENAERFSILILSIYVNLIEKIAQFML